MGEGLAGLELLAASINPLVLTAINGACTVVVAFVAVVIAYRQYKIARGKLNLDLFDKRYKVYKATTDMLALISQGEKALSGPLGDFKEKTVEARFLFGSEVAGFMDVVAYYAVNASTDGPRRGFAIQAANTWLKENRIDILFGRYMNFSKWR